MLCERRVTRALDRSPRRILGGIRVAGSRTAAVDEDDAANSLGIVGGKRQRGNEQPVRLENDSRPHAVADQDAALELEVVDQSGHIAAEMLDRAFLRPPRGLAMAPQVAGYDFIGGFKKIELRTPVLERAGEAVDEDRRGRAAAGADEVHSRNSSASACGLCAAASFCCS